MVLQPSKGSAVKATRGIAEYGRLAALLAIALVSTAGYRALGLAEPAGTASRTTQAALLFALLGLPYAGACWLLLSAPAPRTAGWRRAEWGVLVGGALLFRAAVFPLAPLLSPDAYRYVWDALLTSHGLSPYLHGPAWAGYDALRNARLYAFVPWRQVPSIYPPGAQLLYRIAFAAAPLNVLAIKAEMSVFDLLAGLALIALLIQRGQDPRRAFIYLWAPLPVIEFTLNGHVDAAAIAFTLAALLANGARFRGSRALVGILIGVATLIKLYPLLIVIALVRRRDWSLLGALALTLAAGYAPFRNEGLAATGYLGNYLSQVHSNAGGLLLVIRWLVFGAGWSGEVVQAIGAACAAAGLGMVVWLRMRGRPRDAATRVPPRISLRPTDATFVCIALWLALSPHVFPWYVTALLPFCALSMACSARQTARALGLGIWSFCTLVPLAYVAWENAGVSWVYPALYLASLGVALCALPETRRALLAPRRWPWRMQARLAAGAGEIRPEGVGEGSGE